MNAPQQHPLRKKLTEKSEIAHLALLGGVTTTFMRKFVREAIAVIEAGLLRDGVVKIHNFGTFRLSAPFQSASPQVIFQPAKNIRELVIQAFGPAVHTGSRISLPALMEKHLGIVAPPSQPFVGERKEETILEPFDIAEIFPDFIETPPPAFNFAEEIDEAALATNSFAAEARSSESMSGQPVSTAPADAKPVNGDAETNTRPTFTLAETSEEPVPTSPVSLQPVSQREPTFVLPPARRRRFAWYAGATAIVLFLLFFLWPGRISEKPEIAPRSVVSTTLNRTESPAVPSQVTNEKQPLIAPISTIPKKPAPFFPGGTHRVVLGDKLWALSGTYYRDPYLWPNIYRANTTAIKNPDVLERDQQLALPILYGPPEKLTAEDRRHLAEGYFLLYRHYRTHDPALAPFALWAAVRYDARIKTAYVAELREDDLAFLEAHEVRRVKKDNKVAER